MFNFVEKLQTKNFSKDNKGRPVIIKPTYIMYHHTGWWTYESNKRILLGNTEREVSADFLIWENWQVAKLSEPTYRTWHSWTWNYKWITDMNSHSIWIEVVWPWFTDLQRKALKELTKYLMWVYWINVDNVIRHKDYTSRKVDIDDSLRNAEFKSFDDWKRKKLTNNIL